MLDKVRIGKIDIGQYRRLDCKDQPGLYQSFLDFGFENHTFEILMSGLQAKELNGWEKTWIWAMDAFGPMRIE